MSRPWQVELRTCITLPYLNSKGKIIRGGWTPTKLILDKKSPTRKGLIFFETNLTIYGVTETTIVIVHRLIMYVNPLLIVQAMYFNFKGQSVYTVLGCDFWKYLNGEFVFHETIKIHYSFIMCRIQFYRKMYIYSLLQSNISSLINGYEKTE